MELTYYSIYDSKALCFSQPFLSINNDVAERSFYDLANDNISQISKFPEDFSLFILGTFNDSTGLIVSSLSPINLGLASNYKIKKV